jgi:signal transduction histidine kinase/ActR/RegA family two-component response regulator
VVVANDRLPASVPTAQYDEVRRELDEAREQLDATGEILTAIGRSASDIAVVLGAVVERARRMCWADAALIYLFERGVFRVSVATGVTDDFLDHTKRHPMIADRASLVGRVTVDRRAQQIPDVLADPEYGRPDVQRLGGFRTVLGVPMLIEDEVVGVLTLWRTEVHRFSERAIEVVTAFAAQAAIAIRNVDLLRALETQRAELATKVEQLEALQEIGQAVSSSLDLDELLTTIVTHAVQLTDTDGGSLLELDSAAREFRVRAAYGSSPELLDALRRTSISLDSTLVGRACLEGQPQMERDLENIRLDPHLRLLKDAGWRSVLAVPMQHEGVIVGALVVRRRTAGGFSTDTSGLLQTFASQSALAIVNARLFRELERKSGELQVASRHKSEFLASMSHELRTPLNAVIGFSEVLLERMFGDINERQEDYLRDILGSGRHLLELLNDILDLSKVEAGRLELERTQFPVRPALEQGLAQVRERAAAHSITLELEISPDVRDLEADELRFKQVVLNLLSNAVKFTGDGGHVSVAATVEGDQLCVRVSDTGIGIAPEDRERIFESFEQAGRARDQSEGTGLGLTLCRRIVGLLGGYLWLDSEVGIGSTFGFAVPTGGRVAIRLRGAAGADERPLVVLFADDPRSLGPMSLSIEAAGARTIRAQSDAQGLAAVHDLQPSAAILDIRHAGTAGWRILEALTADPAAASVPVVVIAMLDEPARAMALGAAACLAGPVAQDAVVAALRRVGALPSDVVSKTPAVEETS